MGMISMVFPQFLLFVGFLGKDKLKCICSTYVISTSEELRGLFGRFEYLFRNKQCIWSFSAFYGYIPRKYAVCSMYLL